MTAPPPTGRKQRRVSLQRLPGIACVAQVKKLFGRSNGHIPNPPKSTEKPGLAGDFRPLTNPQVDAAIQGDPKTCAIENERTPGTPQFLRISYLSLSEIFTFHRVQGAEDAYRPHDIPVHLTQICSSWRTLALNIPELWSSITLRFNGAQART
ncbi:hypothetical protein DFH07DRAFT_424486 [Mycena maculata]|uniref:F-box domain-containing protein n=1 Tax=Mycena maculata TaxID=230809 RepID=A0AAD7NHY2_9AGAR|nr:hypothetical protein DFH07DRAFT_424486 [Mycena maculata]